MEWCEKYVVNRFFFYDMLKSIRAKSIGQLNLVFYYYLILSLQARQYMAVTTAECR